MRSLSHRECGALEACDTLLGIPLFVTDPNTTIRWVDVNMVRSRRLKEKSVIESMDRESCDIFFPSWVDSYYPNRPEQLENVHLHNFMSWFDFVRAEPIQLAIYYRFQDGFLKRRTRPYLINHYKYSVDQEAEKYYYALLLLFKPWRNSETLMGSSESYKSEFENCQEQLPDAVNYHNRLQQMQKQDEIVRDQIDRRRTEMEQEEDGSTDVVIQDPLLSAYTEAQGAMAEFEEAVANKDIIDVDSMIEKLNDDQRRVFDRVSSHLQAQNSSTVLNHPEPLRMFVSGCGGTGKSFLIKTLKAWIHSSLEKHAAITAPTGISAFNVNGLTIHRLLQLPVEHGKTPKYRSLSDEAIKIVREKLQHLVLLIVDEISMVSHVTLLYIHLRLTEIFNTGDIKNGWFGCKNILVFGDLLQLPPVFEQPVYTPLTSATVHKHTDSPGGVDIWQPLFEYDELVINMRQKDHHQFTELLGRVRLGKLTANDIKMLNQRKLSLRSASISGRMKEVVDVLLKLPEDTVCLLPTRSMCMEINAEVLSRLPGKEYKLVAEDSVDCSMKTAPKPQD
ncbi:ATP-dependent DNA helicase PIF5-like [Dysidea avara]|uniref:ATP-dependent DNA helicase PIF5-like n=1 Tax=Dysidea avara TaxID=196820 RepID=UPI00332418BF